MPLPSRAGSRPAVSLGDSFVSADDDVIEEANALREQVVALQARLLASEADRLGLERRIREEVSAEMKELMDEREAEMMQRLEEERYATEELYHKKLALVKGTTEKRAYAASVQAHTELLQHTRAIQRREAEHASQLKRLEAELEASRAELARTRSQDEAAVAIAQAQREATEEREARERLEAELADVQAAAAADRGEVEKLEFRLSVELEAKEALASQLADVRGELARASSASQPAWGGSKRLSSSDAVAADADPAQPSPKRPLGEANHLNETSQNDPSPQPLKKTRHSRAGRAGAYAVPSSDGDELSALPPPKRESKLRAGIKNVFKLGIKKGDTPTRGEEFTQVCAPHGKLPEPTPVAKRTRGAMAARV